MLSTSQWRSDDLPADLLVGLRAERTFVSAGDESVSTTTTTLGTGSLWLVAVTLRVYLIWPFYLRSIFSRSCGSLHPRGVYGSSPFVLASVWSLAFPPFPPARCELQSNHLKKRKKGRQKNPNRYTAGTSVLKLVKGQERFAWMCFTSFTPKWMCLAQEEIVPFMLFNTISDAYIRRRRRHSAFQVAPRAFLGCLWSSD